MDNVRRARELLREAERLLQEERTLIGEAIGRPAASTEAFMYGRQAYNALYRTERSVTEALARIG